MAKEYVRGLDMGGGIGSIIYQKKSSGYYYYQYNHKGDVVALTDANGKLAAFYEYDAWGNVMTEAEKTGVDNPYRYSTKEWDEKCGLCYFGARYYSPEIGRWTQRDPAETVDGLNLYLYVGGEPVGSMDIWGLEKTHGWFWYFVFFWRSPHEESATGPSPDYYKAINDPVGEYRAQLDSDFRWGHNAAKDFREKCICIAADVGLKTVWLRKGTAEANSAVEQARAAQRRAGIKLKKRTVETRKIDDVRRQVFSVYETADKKVWMRTHMITRRKGPKTLYYHEDVKSIINPETCMEIKIE